MVSIAPSCFGDASPSHSASVILSRAGSASAACTAARLARSSFLSALIDSILTELVGARQDDAVTGAPDPGPAALWRRLLAELLGSAFLAAIVIGSGIAAQRLSPGNTGLELLENAAATAAGLFAIILMFGPVSGGHFNPVVSFADAVFGGLRWRDAAAYLPAQVAGCIAGAVAANLMFAQAAVSISTKHRATPAHFLSEVIATLGLILVIFALARSGRAASAPAAVGAYIGAAYFFTSSTSFANPAITVGRMFSDTFAGIAPPRPGVHRRPGCRRRPGRRGHPGAVPAADLCAGGQHRRPAPLPRPQCPPATTAPLPHPATPRARASRTDQPTRKGTQPCTW